ncbi:phytanoyl-CoA dioxygenase family protein [Paenibacillus eucommiae]|uniref:Site-specific DNA-cytosine methylase n=1 Tax=Paenibacillus eucommiae TaxID=1355755 RepID=A0ABS4IQ98_9BACL|nr:phytanoyl-CoA dioxygenase family protein [Paenibacillus eucommiae]MBP1989683.1 site-specific DNA-cytosine methylase [Paenibacillus eucommiae]
MFQLKSAYRQFTEEGYLILPQLFSGKQLETLLTSSNYVLEQFMEEHYRQNPNTDFLAMRHLNDPRWHRDTREHFNVIMETIADPRCLGSVEQIFAGPSLFRSTTYYANPQFTSQEGEWHRDSQFVVKDEQEEKKLLEQVWKSDGSYKGIQLQISLIDNDDLEYVPYSINRNDSPEENYIRYKDNKSHNREEGMPNAMRIALKAGDAVIFNPFGLHRGRYYKEISRRSLMLTYTPLSQPIYDSFSNQPWFGEPGYLDGLSPRAAAYLQQFTDIYRSSWAQP